MITPRWPTPKHIKACTLTAPDQVDYIKLPVAILRQVHGNAVIEWDEKAIISYEPCTISMTEIQADGVYTTKPDIVCAIRTADCLPLLVTNKAGTEVSALHAGWRGLAAGVIEAGIAKFQAKAEDLLVWLGPAICAQHYEVGVEVYQAFVDQNAALADCFTATRPGHWLADLNTIACKKLQNLGISQIFQSQQCTFEDKALHSYRRDATDSGRLVHCIWIDSAQL